MKRYFKQLLTFWRFKRIAIVLLPILLVVFLAHPGQTQSEARLQDYKAENSPMAYTNPEASKPKRAQTELMAQSSHPKAGVARANVKTFFNPNVESSTIASTSFLDPLSIKRTGQRRVRKSRLCRSFCLNSR